MGNCWGRVFRRRNNRRHIVLILIGLDNAGKTKTVNNLAGDNDDKVLPTVGFKAVNLSHRDTPVTIFDLGGGPQFRQIWSQYYSEVHGVIFVIDSSDFSRLEECKVVLEEVLSHDKVSGKPVLILANKQDKQGALDDIDVVEKLNIEPLVNKYRCPTLVESYAAAKVESNSKKAKLDPGLRKGYQWLLNYIESRYGDLNLRVQTDIHADLQRRKMMSSNANTASQTFLVSDDIATQTGFENPNYDSLSRKSDPTKDLNKTDDGLIMVKPANHKPNSEDSTLTVESVEYESESTDTAKPKLSPLFGRASNTNSTETVQIELEPKNSFRKLSPISRKRSAVNHIDFKDRPQSSPTFKKSSIEANSNSLKENELDDTMGDGRGIEEDARVDKKNAIIVDPTIFMQMQKELIIAERMESTNKVATSEVLLSSQNQGAASPEDNRLRPASASQLVRRQLEIFPGAHKRRLSLRYVHRNKTSPETLNVFHFAKTLSRLDKGDFENHSAHNYLTHRDVTL